MQALFGAARKPKTCYSKVGAARKPKTCYSKVGAARKPKTCYSKEVGLTHDALLYHKLLVCDAKCCVSRKLSSKRTVYSQNCVSPKKGTHVIAF